jgi:hypothetical protein
MARAPKTNDGKKTGLTNLDTSPGRLKNGESFCGEASVKHLPYPPLPRGEEERARSLLPAATVTATAARRADGKFAKGNPGGPGNPHARETARILQLMRSGISDEAILDLTLKLVELGRQGDVGAIKLIFSYKIGKPQPAPQPDWIEHEGWAAIKKAVVDPADLKRVLGAPQAPLINTICGIMLPVIEKQQSDNFLHTHLADEMKALQEGVMKSGELGVGRVEEKAPEAGSASDRKNGACDQKKDTGNGNGKPMQSGVNGTKPMSRHARQVAKILTERLRNRM